MTSNVDLTGYSVCKHGDAKELCPICLEDKQEAEQRAAYAEIMEGVKLPEVVSPGLSVKDIYATIKAGRRVALTFETYSEAADVAVKLQHHLSVMRSADKKLSSAFQDFEDFTVKFILTTVGDSPVQRRVVFSRDIPTDVKRFTAFEILDE